MTSRANKKRQARRERDLNGLIDLWSAHIRGEIPVQVAKPRKWLRTVWGMNWKPTYQPERLWETKKLEGYYLKHREEGAE